MRDYVLCTQLRNIARGKKPKKRRKNSKYIIQAPGVFYAIIDENRALGAAPEQSFETRIHSFQLYGLREHMLYIRHSNR